MARENFIDHVAPDGSTVVQRIQASGYPLPLWYGEALSGYGSDAGATVNALLNSPTHRAILLDDRFTDVGIGYSPEFTAGGGPRWTFTFASSIATITPEPVSTGTVVAGITPTATLQPVTTGTPTTSGHRVYLPSVNR
jgi:hypothetical protein